MENIEVIPSAKVLGDVLSNYLKRNAHEVDKKSLVKIAFAQVT